MYRKKKPVDDTKVAVGEAGATATPPASVSLLRLQRDMAELDLTDGTVGVKMGAESGERGTHTVTITLRPAEGLWKGSLYEFTVTIPSDYPFSGPKVECADRIYHPNIDFDGGVCVSVLRPWKPTSSLQHIIFGLLLLFSDPNPNDPLNNDVAEEMRNQPKLFERNVATSLSGGSLRGINFPKNRGFA